MVRPVEGIRPGHGGYIPTLYDECHGIFNDHRESGSRFNVSSLYWGVRIHTDHRVSTPCWPH